MIAHIGSYCLTVVGDEVAVTDMRRTINLDNPNDYTLAPTTVDGLAKFLSWKKGIAVKMVYVEDMEIIYLIRRGTRYGTSYAINLTEPYFSEYGDCGLAVPA